MDSGSAQTQAANQVSNLYSLEIWIGEYLALIQQDFGIKKPKYLTRVWKKLVGKYEKKKQL